jgi:hypothetical protein
MFSNQDLLDHGVDLSTLKEKITPEPCLVKSNSTGPYFLSTLFGSLCIIENFALCTAQVSLPGQVNETCGAVTVQQFTSGKLISAFEPGVRQCGGGMVLPLFPGTVLYLLCLAYFTVIHRGGIMGHYFPSNTLFYCSWVLLSGSGGCCRQIHGFYNLVWQLQCVKNITGGD